MKMQKIGVIYPFAEFAGNDTENDSTIYFSICQW